MKRIILFLLIIAFAYMSQPTMAQGCVAVRSNGGTCLMDGRVGSASSIKKSLTVSLNTRYFTSFRHFSGGVEQKHRIEKGTQVINHTVSTELGMTKNFDRWSFAVYLPLINNVRSSLYEHDGKNRHSTNSFGMGDLRLGLYYWIFDPEKKSAFRLQAGLGLKLPTGDYKYQDYFYKNDSVKVLGPVDQSIQLGDGGTGITMEANAFYDLTGKVGLFLNGFYLLIPREQNGVSTARGGTTSATSIIYGSDVMSVPDQYMLRVGASYGLGAFHFSGGMRLEGLPARDLLGGSNGFRRPGYIISAEPVLSFQRSKAQFYISVPIAVDRNRIQSVPDKIRTTKTGVYTRGDAAFSDYSINLGMALKL